MPIMLSTVMKLSKWGKFAFLSPKGDSESEISVGIWTQEVHD